MGRIESNQTNNQTIYYMSVTGVISPAGRWWSDLSGTFFLSPLTNYKKMSGLGPLWQNFLDQRISSALQGRVNQPLFVCTLTMNK